MKQNFSLADMQTYFRNYIPCQHHFKEPITNFCTERACLKFLCPECVENHSQISANHPIDSIKTCIKKTSKKLTDTISKLDFQINRHAFLKSKTPDDYNRQLLKELQQVKRSIITEINSYFKQKQIEIQKLSQHSDICQQNLTSLKKQLSRAVQQLKMLNSNLFNTKQTVKAIKKANAIDYEKMVKHFQKRIEQVHDDLSYEIKVQMNARQRQQFRSNLNSLVKIANTNKHKQSPNNFPSKNPGSITSNRPDQYFMKNQQSDRQSRTQQFVANPYPLSVDRLLNQTSLKIDTKNYFIQEPFLHFFDITKNNLHVLPIKDIQQSQVAKQDIIPLQTNFMIPSFHRTVATEDGKIILIGGNNANMTKSNKIYQYDPIKRILVETAHMSVGRSSHSIVCYKKIIYITGGVSDSDTALKISECYNTMTGQMKTLQSCHYATLNSTLAYINENLVKIGGVMANGQNSEHIEIYNIHANLWGQIDPQIQNIKGQFGLLSCSGWSPLNQKQIFIFGGYNQQNNNQNSRMSFVLQCSQNNQFTIKYINAKNLPIAAGFWNQQGFAHEQRIYCLQNIDDEQQDKCLAEKRNVLTFNGKYWSTCQSQ